ncbi:hypothetical protein HRbin30_02139 [bacterium HR30]|nr:hypothetical protein HRbin30_02139 [bacterium HR30]
MTVKEGCAEQGSGGGISASFGATVTVTSSTISNNSAAGFGGGIDNFGTVTLTNSALSDNSAVFTGGGMRNTFGSTATVTNSTVSGNSAGFDGGAIENSGTVTITGSTISNNSSGDDGGGIMNFGKVTLTNSTISGNSSGGSLFEDGGGIWNDGEVNASFITIANNTGSSSGAGGIFNDSGGTLNMKNSIVGDNTAGGSSNCQNLGTINASGVNLATDSNCGAGFTSVSSAALNLGPLANNGGPTQTHALQSGSAAIDAVTDCTDLGSASVTADQRGISRPQGPRCDVGAYEVLRAGAAPLPAVAPLGRLVLLTLLVLTGIGALWRRSRELGAARD